MALMFPRLAHNYAKAGYYPTDAVTLERTLQALAPSPTLMRIIDPCAGEGVAIAEAGHALGRDTTEIYAVEYDKERADHTRQLVDRTLHSDLMDTIISSRSFGLLFLNPPYGDLPKVQNDQSLYQGEGKPRLEKLFYQRTFPLLQYGGVLVFIVPYYVLDAELSQWLCNHFTDLRIYTAAESQFKQVVIFGVRTRQSDRGRSADVKAVRDKLIAIGRGELKAEELPAEWPWAHYTVPAASADKPVEHFYRISLESEQFVQEIKRLRGLWPEFQTHFNQAVVTSRQPARQLSPWHLALALAAGEVSGVIHSHKTGKTLIVKGDTHKEKSRKVEVTTDDEGNVTETTIMLDRFVPVIKAWDMTQGSDTFGSILTIKSGVKAARAEIESIAASLSEPDETLDKPFLPSGPHSPSGLFPPGNICMTIGVNECAAQGKLDLKPYLVRHLSGDWGEISLDDWNLNNASLKPGNEGRLFSSYNLESGDEDDDKFFGPKLWIITEWDRSVTTLMFPSEY